MSEILSKMTREQALGCVHQEFRQATGGLFVLHGIVYNCPSDIGLADPHVNCDCSENCFSCWKQALNAHYDALEKPKWVEPESKCSWVVYPRREGCNEKLREHFYAPYVEAEAEIARTNARRRIEAFIAANGGGGRYTIYWNEDEFLAFNSSCSETIDIGAITCATEELAEAVIERFPDELRLLAGLEDNE
jgi:hypothetical protein